MSKYKAIKEVVDGITFASRKEARRYRQLKLLERAREIQGLELQVSYPLIKKSKYGREIKYIADFVYLENGKTIVEDVKSKATVTPVYRLKKRLMQELYGITIKEVY